MLFEVFWVMYGLEIGIFFGIGILGLCFSFSNPSSVTGGISRKMSFLLSILIIVTGAYFFYEWNAQKAEIRKLEEQIELGLQQFLTPHQNAGMAWNAGRP